MWALWQTKFKSSISKCDATAVAETIMREVRRRLEPAMDGAQGHITVLWGIHGIDDGRESREGVADGLGEGLVQLQVPGSGAVNSFGHKRQNTSRPSQQVDADDLCIAVSFFENEGAESLTSAHIHDPKRASRTGAQLADARAKRELVLTEMGQLHL